MRIIDELIECIKGMAVIAETDTPQLFILEMPEDATKEIADRFCDSMQSALMDMNIGHQLMYVPHGFIFTAANDDKLKAYGLKRITD